MKNRTSITAAAALMLGGALGTGFAQQSSPAAPQQLRVTIDTRQTARPVSSYEYGMFIEHIGALIYRSLWSEMLDDRKFYFPITLEEPQPAAPVQGGPFRNCESGTPLVPSTQW
jgi:alpha-L-arabinofuranosidase